MTFTPGVGSSALACFARCGTIAAQPPNPIEPFMSSTPTQLLPSKPFYTADCAIEDVGIDPHPSQKGKVEAWALGRAILVSGEIELHFNWVARGGDSLQTAFDFAVELDEEEPDFELQGLPALATDDQHAVIKHILESGPWQAEILECLPKNQTELAALQ